MKRYEFRLKRVLDIKKVLQDIRRREMAEAVRKFEEEKAVLEGMEGDMESAQVFIASKARGRFRVSEMAVHYTYMGLLRTNMDRQSLRIGEANQKMKAANRKLVDAYHKREVISRLEERAKAEYRDEVQKEEQAVIDEINGAAFFRGGN